MNVIARKFMAWLVLFAAMLCLPLMAEDKPESGFYIQDGQVVQKDDVYVLNVQIDHIFSDAALEALENGVPLVVDLHVQVRRNRAWIWEEDIVDMHLMRQLRYLPLSSGYEVIDINSRSKRSFASKLAAIEALGELSDYAVVATKQLEPGEEYRVELRSSLDIESLPVPLRPTAYMSSAWKLSSDWKEWLIKP